MKNTILLFLIITLTSCNHNEKKDENEAPLTFDDYCTKSDETVLESKSIPKKDQKLFLNYHLNMSQNQVDSVTRKNIIARTLKTYNDTLYLNLKKGCNFIINSTLEDNRLKIINLTYVWEYKKNSGYYTPKTYYNYYFKILCEKYGNPISMYEDINDGKNNTLGIKDDKGAFWIKDGIVITFTEYNNWGANILDNDDKFVETMITYQELADRKKRILDGRHAEILEKQQIQIQKKKTQKENLKQDSVFRSNF